MSYETLIKEIFELHNEIRTNPKSFIPFLTSQLKKFQGLIYRRADPDGIVEIETSEGKAAVSEAIEYLKKAKPKDPLVHNRRMRLAAQRHADDLGKHGLCESIGSDGRFPDERIKEHLSFTEKIGESLDFNSYTAEDILFSCLVDDGISDRSRRKNFFSSSYCAIGIGISAHKEYGNCIVFDYVGGSDLKELENDEIDNEQTGVEENNNGALNEEEIGEGGLEQPYEVKYIRQLEDLDNYDEIVDEEGPEDAVAVQIIYEQVRSANSNLLRQIKIYYDETSPIETITKIYKN